MLAQRFAQALGRHGIHYAWVMAALTFLSMLSMAAALGVPGALIRPLGQEFGWTTDQIASALSVRFFLFGMLGPFAALLMARHGVPRVLLAGLVTVTLALALSTRVTQLWQLFLLWGVAVGLGSGVTALVLGSTVASRWFVQHRGLVVGLLTASSATGQLLFLPLAAWLVERAGWRMALLPMIGIGTVAGLLVFLLMADRPEELGLAPVGAPPAPQSAAGGPASRMAWSEPFRLLAEASRDATFWVLAGSFYICGLSTNGLIQTHFITLCGDFGLAPVPAASVLAMMGAFDLVGTILSGWLSDRYDNRRLLCWYYGLRGLSLLWLPHSTFTFYGLSLFAMFYGLDWIATVPPTVRLIHRHFQAARAGMVLGWVFAAHQLGAATAAWLAGLSRTLLLSYTPALYGAGLACVLAALLVLGIARPQPAGRATAA